MKSKFIAISAISASLTAIVLLVGVYIDFFDVFSIVISSVFVILPLYYDSTKGCFLTYLAGGVVALICGIGKITSVVFPSYFVFFGIYPIIRCVVKKTNFNPYLFKFLGLIWCVLAGYLMFYYYSFFTGALSLSGMPQFIKDNVELFVGVFGFIFYFVYDRFIAVSKIIEDRYLKRIIK